MDPTAHVPLGRTSVPVTRLGFGTVPIAGLFGGVDEPTARATIDRAWDLGVRFFDTAPLYGYGVGEQRLGAALRERPRDEYVVSTKVGRLLRPEQPPEGEDVHGGTRLWKGELPPLKPQFDFSYDAAMRSVEESLERLGLDRVDVLLIHDPDEHYDAALKGAYLALEKLRSEGVVGAIGAGMNQAEMLARFARETDMNCFLVAGRYTLLDQAALAELLPLCVERQISVIIGGVFNSGILTDPKPGATFNYAPAEPKWLERAQALATVCARHNVPLKAAAVQFPLAHPAIATVLTGVRSPAEIEENARLFQHPIPAALWDDLRTSGLLPIEAPTPVSG